MDINNSNILLPDSSTQFYNLQLSKCKFEYYYDIDKFWSKHNINSYYNINLSKKVSNGLIKENEKINLNNADENLYKSLDIIQEFSFYLRLEIANDTKCNFDITQISININNHLANKLNSLTDVFKIDTKIDIFESKFKTKNEIAKNSTKRGKIDLIINDNSKKKYWCVLAGGFIYLFDNIENEYPDIAIPLKHLKYEKLIDGNIFKLRFFNKMKRKNINKFEYLFVFENSNLLESWIIAINDRKGLMKNFSQKIRSISIKKFLKFLTC